MQIHDQSLTVFYMDLKLCFTQPSANKAWFNAHSIFGYRLLMSKLKSSENGYYQSQSKQNLKDSYEHTAYMKTSYGKGRNIGN